ncbi:MAG: hypothetical protein ACLPPF_17320 [Rhodomicrobium sp.]
MTDIPENVDLRFIAIQLHRMDGRIGKLEANMNERFLRQEAEIARLQADVSETKAIGREVALRLTFIEKRLAAVEHA